MIDLKNIHKRFNPGTINEIDALKGVSLSIGEKEFVTVIGTNGSGKSTLLNAVAGTFLPDSGKILIAGNDVTDKKDFERAGYVSRVFQNPFMGTAPDMTIAENLLMAVLRGERRYPRIGLHAGRLARFREEVSKLEMQLEGRLDAVIGTLSGGQRQAISLLMNLMPGVFEHLDEERFPQAVTAKNLERFPSPFRGELDAPIRRIGKHPVICKLLDHFRH